MTSTYSSSKELLLARKQSELQTDKHRQNLNINNPLHFRVPFICKFKPGIPGIFTPSNYEEGEDEDDYYAESEEIDQLGEEMYSLKVQLVSDDEKRSTTLLEKRTDSAMV